MTPPTKVSPKQTRPPKNSAAAKQKEEENVQLHRENEGLRQQYAKDRIDRDELLGQIEELQAAIAARNEQISSLLEQLNAQPVSKVQETPAEEQPRDKAAALVEKLAALPNVTAIIKGARTAAPVVWLSGDADTHKADGTPPPLVQVQPPTTGAGAHGLQTQNHKTEVAYYGSS